MKRSLLNVLMVVALGAVICLPGVAAAGIFLDFNLGSGITDLNAAGGDYDLFTWGGWTVEANGTVSASGVATISPKKGTFDFEGAKFASTGGTTLTISGTKVGAVQSLDLTYESPLTFFSAPQDFKNITQLTFTTTTGGSFVMDDFQDALKIPLPPTALLLGSGLLGLAGWRRSRKG